MRVRVQKWGNSLALRIPKPFAEEAGVHERSELDLTASPGRLVGEVVPEPRYDLRALLRRVTRTNRHGEADFGPRVGREAW